MTEKTKGRVLIKNKWMERVVHCPKCPGLSWIKWNRRKWFVKQFLGTNDWFIECGMYGERI